MVSRSLLYAAAIVVVGVVLVGVAGYQLAQPDYTHHVEHVAAGEVPAGAPVTQHENLSTAGQDVMQQAFEASDDRVAVTAENRPPDFTYGDGAVDHYVVFHGEYYRVTTGGGGVLSGVDGLLAWGLLALGALAVLGGGFDLYRQRVGTD